jgi:membrane protein YqaA with SNARE-associated domain
MTSPAEEQPDGTSGADGAPRRGLVRRLYDWMLHWAHTPYGTPALAALSFAESSFFPIPPDVLQIALSVSRPRRAFFYAAVSAVASVAGAVLGWAIGYLFWEALSEFFYSYVPGCTEENFQLVGERYRDNATLTIIGAAFTPIPFKVFTIAAGTFHQYVSLSTLILASLVGRSARFFLVATFVYFFGQRAKELLDKYFALLTFLLFALLVGGFMAVKWLL